MSNMEQAVANWQDTLIEAYTMLFSNPEDWNADVWHIVKSLNSSMVLVGSVLLGLMFMIGICKQMTDFKQLRQLEFWVGPFLRLVIANFVMVKSLDLMMKIFAVCQALLSKVGRIGSVSYNISVPDAVSKAIDDTSFWVSPLIGLLGLLMLVMCLILSISLLTMVWGRFLRMYLYTAVAPVFIAIGGGEATQNAAATFIKSWVSVCLQGVIMMLALVIYTKLITTDSSQAVQLIESGETLAGIMRYARDFSVGAFVTILLCKSADQIINKMIGW